MLKRLFFFVLTLAGLFWLANTSYKGKPLYQQAWTFFGSEKYSEGMKDIKILLGGFLKTVGQKIEEDVTEKDQKALDNLIKKEVLKEEKK